MRSTPDDTNHVDLDEIATFALEILEQKSICQQDPDGDDEGAQDADSSEYEAALISNAADVFGAMASVLGPDFAQAFPSVLPMISKYSVCGISVPVQLCNIAVCSPTDT